ncbi:hypothetical protein B0H14DRAFT_309125 [Mycena olivaceomarginata]|nr:hypothetical protein B0H14DRAFT_309125 [Mycena olivaceomarginata]
MRTCDLNLIPLHPFFSPCPPAFSPMSTPRPPSFTPTPSHVADSAPPLPRAQVQRVSAVLLDPYMSPPARDPQVATPRPNLSCTTAHAMRLRCAPYRPELHPTAPALCPTHPARPLPLGSTDSACTLRPTSESGHTPAHGSRPDLGRTIARAWCRLQRHLSPPLPFPPNPMWTPEALCASSALPTCPSNPVSLVCFAPLRHLLSYVPVPRHLYAVG